MSESRPTVLSPELLIIPTTGGAPAEGARPASSLAPRLDALEGKTVYLVDAGFGGSYRFMQELQRWFADNLPAVKTIRKRKPGGPFADDNDALWEEIKQRGDAAVLGVGG